MFFFKIGNDVVLSLETGEEKVVKVGAKRTVDFSIEEKFKPFHHLCLCQKGVDFYGKLYIFGTRVEISVTLSAGLAYFWVQGLAHGFIL